MIRFDSRNNQYKSPFGAVPSGTRVDYFVYCDEYAENAKLNIYRDEETINIINMLYDASDSGFRATYEFTSEGLYFYSICINGRYVTQNGLSDEEVRFQQTVYIDSDVQPRGYAGGIMYQIFPDRFNIGSCGILSTPFGDRVIHTDKNDIPAYLPDETGEYRNNDYFGGNLRGIEEKIPYLKSLGVTVLYLNPIGEAHSNHRYNTADYMKVDPLLGTEEDFKSLCKACRKAGIKVILDGVYSHTGDDSIYFNRYHRYDSVGAYESESSPYRKWYVFNEDGTYRAWWDFESLPEVNEKDPSYTQFICGKGGVIDHWMSLGASGFRLDVADELPDSFIKEIRKAIKAYGKDCLLIGEVWEDASNKISYGERRTYLYGDELDTVMNYPFREAIIGFLKTGNACEFMDTVMSVQENYPKRVTDILMNSLSTHDTERIITSLIWNGEGDRAAQAAFYLNEGDYLKGVELVKLATVLQFTLPGIPCIYYGDEIGMQGCKDPFNRGYMKWDQADENILSFTRRMADFRKTRPALTDGVFVPYVNHDGFLSFFRKNDQDSLLVAVNISNEEVNLVVDDENISIKPWQFVLK